ncbi:MAG: ribonucleoside-diphosphate reductase subunit alpha [Rickettsia sp.]|nr:ribonucleoside-diphosphate reductase subunit alpha [Rickettsia sp.]
MHNLKYNIEIDPSKDSLLSDFGKKLLKNRYLFGQETYQDLFARISSYYANNEEHAIRLYKYISNLWFMPATPILSNGGTSRGLPISCFVNETSDSLQGIVDLWYENAWLASKGGGIGSYWGNVRSINEIIGKNGTTSGIVPFIKVQDSMTLAISQGSLRRGSAAVYIDVSHPEIEEFLEIRKPTGGDINRKSLNLHQAVVIDDKFMYAVEQNLEYNLISPNSSQVIATLKARDLWIKILTTRIETGEPYLLFIDNVNRNINSHHKKLGLKVKTSNLCSEITLPTGKDHLNLERTAVCCLSSLNLEYFYIWEKEPEFISDIMYFLDNVLQDFIDKAPDSMSKAKYSAERERSVGLGVMGFHSFLQKNNLAFESNAAQICNERIFSHIAKQSHIASENLAKERGACPDSKDSGGNLRFSNTTAIAPTASISLICNNTSPGIEPFAANNFVLKNLTGSFPIKNKNLVELLEKKGLNKKEIWSSIASNEGSVQHFTFLSEHEKMVYRTAYEIDQNWIIKLAAERTKFISQSQSLNVFLPGDVSKSLLHNIHFSSWKNGIKSLYYLRSRSVQRADKVSHLSDFDKEQHKKTIDDLSAQNEDSCLSCQ